MSIKQQVNLSNALFQEGLNVSEEQVHNILERIERANEKDHKINLRDEIASIIAEPIRVNQYTPDYHIKAERIVSLILNQWMMLLMKKD